MRNCTQTLSTHKKPHYPAYLNPKIRYPRNGKDEIEGEG